MPLIRRIPKRGFNNAEFKIQFAVVNLISLNAFDEGAKVSTEMLLSSGLIRRPFDKIKILGSGELKKVLTITAHKASETARAAIEKAGGTLILK